MNDFVICITRYTNNNICQGNDNVKGIGEQMLKFNAIIKNDLINSAYVEVPYDVPEFFGFKIVKVKVNYDDYETKSKIIRVEDNYLLPMSIEVKEQINKQIGDSVFVEVDKDNDEPEVNMDSDLKEAIEDNYIALDRYMDLPYSQKKKYNKWIESARKEDAKVLRIGQFIEELMQM